MWFLYAILGNVCWTTSDVMNSIMIKHFEKSPLVISWFASVFGLICLACMGLVMEVEVTWIPVYAMTGIAMFFGNLFYYFVLHRLDVSVMNAAWVFMNIFISAYGLLFFGETWSMLQWIGVLLSITGVLILSYWHQHVSIGRTVGYLTLLGLFFAPLFLVQKAALLEGQSIASSFYWTILISELCHFIAPIFHAPTRNRIQHHVMHPTPAFFQFCLWAVVIWLSAFLLVAYANQIAYVSIVMMFENAQPFVTICVAWIFAQLLPKYAPRELLTIQSVQTKIISFTIVFIGLVLLALS